VVEAAVLAPVVAILSPAPLFLGVGSSGDKYSMRAVQVAAGERLHLLQLSGDRTLLTASVAAGNCSACNHTSAAGAAATVAADRFFPLCGFAGFERGGCRSKRDLPCLRLRLTGVGASVAGSDRKTRLVTLMSCSCSHKGA